LVKLPRDHDWSNVLGDDAVAQMKQITDAKPAPPAVPAAAASAVVPAAAASSTGPTTTEPNVAAVDAPKIQSNLTKLAIAMQKASLNASDPNAKQYASISNLLTSAMAKVAKVPPAVPTVPPLSAAAAAPAPAAGIGGSTTDNPARSPLAPKEAVGDGNACQDDEEMDSGTCYKKCSDLTGGSHPIRTSAFSCCASKPCTFSNTWTHMGMCFGYDVAADSHPGKCPHTPGACLTDEDDFNNMCYKKCSLLTNGGYPNRVAAATCCKKTGWECFLINNIKTDASFASGGGAGDGNSGTPAAGHPPLTGLTR